jgi:putative ABC transport system ATP-binding protein
MSTEVSDKNLSADQLLFELEQKTEPTRLKKAAVAAGSGVFAVTAAFAAHKFGLGHGVTIQPGASSEIATALEEANSVLLEYGPDVTIGCLAVYLYQQLQGKVDERSATLNLLAKTELSGLDTLFENQNRRNSKTYKIRQKIRRFRREAGTAAVITSITAATLALGDELVKGSLRPVDEAIQTVAPDVANPKVILQSRNASFMDDSAIPKDVMEGFAAYAATQGIKVVPFGKKLPLINNEHGLAISVPDTRFSELTGIKTDNLDCENPPAIVDDTVEGAVGSKLDLNGTGSIIVAKKPGITQAGRNVVVLPDTGMECWEHQTDDAYFGAVVTGGTTGQIKGAEDHENLQYPVLEAEDFKDANRQFWKLNVIGLIDVLIGCAAGLGAGRAAGERKNALQRSAREHAIFNDEGVPMRDFRKVEIRRALRETTLGSGAAALGLIAVASSFNMAEQGLAVSVGPRDLAAGFTVTVSAKLFAGLRGVNSLDKSINASRPVSKQSRKRRHTKNKVATVSDENQVGVEDVVHSYKRNGTRTDALKGVSFETSPNDLTLIVGENASGKSTLLKIMSGQLKPSESGRVTHRGQDITAMTTSELESWRAKQGRIHQDYRLAPGLSVVENIFTTHKLVGNNIDPEWAVAVIKELGLENLMDRRTTELSGGQQQKVAAARALVHQPDIIFADEPTGALDKHTKTEFHQLLRSFVDNYEATVLMVSHEEGVEKYADEVVKLDDGRLVSTTRIAEQ